MGSRSVQPPERAMRFPVHLPIRYRVPETDEWLEAQTENVSRTGVLFETERMLEPSTVVDVKMEVPSPPGQASHAEVICRCEVVRVEPSSPHRIAPVVAVEIQNYRILRKAGVQRPHDTCRARNS